MISVLLLLALFAVLQVAVFFYVRNVVAASASAGARYGASLGASPASGAARASQLIGASLGGSVSSDIACSSGAARDPSSGLPVVQVRCSGPLQLTFLPLHSPLSVSVSALSLQETQP
jgi:Flp pilus assembly protein TadG